MKRVAIVGLGLIGGSIAKRLKQNDPEQPIATIGAGFQEWKELVEWSDLIVLATPLRTIVPIAREIRAHAGSPVMVIDVGSVKGEICLEFEQLTGDGMEFLGTHPMAGKAQWGFEASDPALFEGARWLLTPHGKNRPETVAWVGEWVRELGAVEKVLSAEEHDRKVALISHFPRVLSKALLAFVQEMDPEAIELAGPGFQSMTRLAHDNPEMHREIAQFNSAHLERVAQKWKERVL